MINKFLAIINLPRHIKRYFIIRKIENHVENKRNRGIIIFLNFFIAGLVIGAFGYIFCFDSNIRHKWFGLAAAVLLLIGGVIYISRFVLKFDKEHQSVSKLILRDKDGRNVKMWNLQRQTSLVIGKSLEFNVDIDLEEADYASLISKEHAVLNYADHNWYVEDVGSTNGSGIKKRGENPKLRLEPGKPYKLNPGDIIYIANTQLLVQ